MVKILSIIDDRAGNNSQVIGISNLLASYLGSKADLITINIKDNYTESSGDKKIIICAGNKGTKFACSLKSNLKNSIVITSMWPGFFSAIWCDIIILPEHDSSHLLFNHKIIRVLGAPHKINTQSLEKAKIYLDRRIVGVLIGGSHKSGKFTKEMALELCDILKRKFAEEKCFYMISTSRRTGDEILDIIIQELSEIGVSVYKSSDLSEYIYDYRDTSVQNPYMEILANADEIICTGDSISMMSEAIATKKPLYIYYNNILAGKKHLEMIKKILSNGYGFDILNKENNSNKFQTYDLMSDLLEKLLRKLNLD